MRLCAHLFLLARLSKFLQAVADICDDFSAIALSKEFIRWPVAVHELLQVIALQQIFDWQKYYTEDETLEKKFRGLCTGITGTDLESVRKKLDLQRTLYSRQAELWSTRLARYMKGISQLRHLLDDTAYGNNLTNRQIAIPILADVQTRAMESIEKLIWNEM